MSEDMKKSWYKKWWGIALIIFGALVVISAIANPPKEEKNTTQPTVQEKQTNESKPAAAESKPEKSEPAEAQNEPDQATEEEPADQTKEKPSLSLEDIYNQVQLKMNEQQVREIAGEPAMVNEVEMQGLGTVKNLVYTEGVDNVTISVQNGEAKVIVLGRMVNGQFQTKSKM